MSTRCTPEFMLSSRAVRVAPVARAPTTVHFAHFLTWNIAPTAPTAAPCPCAPSLLVPHLFIRASCSDDGMTPHAQEPTPVHTNRIGLHGQRGAPGLWQSLPHRAHAHHPFRVASISGEKRILHAKTSAPPQRKARAGTVGGSRPRQVPWMIAARSCSRRFSAVDVV